MPETYVEKYAMILTIPKINLVYGIYNKDSNLNKLNNGLYLYDTSTMPNKDGVVIIAGHSGSGYLAIFNHLNELEIDDEVSLSYQNQKYDYKVSEIKKLYYKDNPNIMLDRKHRYVLLITCDKNDKKNRLIYICQNK